MEPGPGSTGTPAPFKDQPPSVRRKINEPADDPFVTHGELARMAPDQNDGSILAIVDGLRALILEKDRAQRQLMDERDARYEDRLKYLDTIIGSSNHAQDKYNTVVQLTTKEATEKAERAQQEFNHRFSESRQQIAEQTAMLMPRKEAEGAITSIRDQLDREMKLVRADIAILRESRSAAEGSFAGKTQTTNFIVTAVGLLVSLIVIGGVVISIAGSIASKNTPVQVQQPIPVVIK